MNPSSRYSKHWLNAQQQADLSEPDLIREMESTAYRLRMNHDKSELTQIELLLRPRIRVGS
jgi:hypothetical protein